MSAMRPGETGATRTCPHCKATLLESAAVCPACRGHLRFDAPAVEAAQRGFRDEFLRRATLRDALVAGLRERVPEAVLRGPEPGSPAETEHCTSTSRASTPSKATV